MLVCAVVCSKFFLQILGCLEETDTKSEVFGLDTQLQFDATFHTNGLLLMSPERSMHTTISRNNSSMHTARPLLLWNTR